MDEYRNEFQPLKDILNNSGFDISNIGFRENDAGTWDVRDVIQRLGCFLKDKPALGPQLYKSKGKALKMYIDPKTRPEFLALEDVMIDGFLAGVHRNSVQQQGTHEDEKPLRRSRRREQADR
jgi:hypothetical protein